MTTIALPNSAPAVATGTDTASRGRLRRLFDALIARRMHQAERVANARLGAVSDARLMHLCLSAHAIAAVRAGKRIGDVLAGRR